MRQTDGRSPCQIKRLITCRNVMDWGKPEYSKLIAGLTMDCRQASKQIGRMQNLTFPCSFTGRWVCIYTTGIPVSYFLCRTSNEGVHMYIRTEAR